MAPETIKDGTEKVVDMFETIKERGFAEYFKAAPHLEKAFSEGHSKQCSCIDEGMKGGRFRLAGSGILHRGGPEAVADMFINAGIFEIISHDNCGAAAAYAKPRGLDPDKAGIDFAAQVVEIMNQKLAAMGAAERVYHKHIAADEMLRPAARHPARVAYYDCTGAFNPAALRGAHGLPPGFVVSRAYYGEQVDEAKRDIAIAISIALGEHGLGGEITVENPFYVVVVAPDQDELVVKEAELKDAVAEYGARVILTGVVPPPAKK